MKKYLSAGRQILPAIIFSIAFVLLLLFLNTRNSLNFVENSPTVEITPTAIPTETKWQTYRNDKYGFEFSYPLDWKIRQLNATNELYSSEISIEKSYGDYGYPMDSITILKLKKNKEYYLDGLIKSTNKDSYSIIDYKLGSDISAKYEMVSNQQSKIPDLKLTQMIYFSTPKGDFGIIFGIGANPDNWNVVTQILSTFKFINNTKYTCPTSEWVNCMPGPGPSKPQCQPEYLKWASNNCPNFKGAAL